MKCRGLNEQEAGLDHTIEDEVVATLYIIILKNMV